MNPRLAKELRPLLLPWCLCALAGFVYWFGLFSHGTFGRFLSELPVFAFVPGCLLLAAIPLGSEFQHRTWPVLLGQPLGRFQMWKEKMLAGTIAVITLATAHGLILLFMGRKIPPAHVLPWAGFVVATACSAGFWVLAARSIIGGMVFAASTQFIVTLVVTGAIYGCYTLLGRNPDDPGINQWPIVATYIFAGVAYSASTLWLGWRTFAKLELREAAMSPDLALPDWMTPKQLLTRFRCQPTGNLKNLIRKELGLQKPIFTIAAVFTACWLAALLLLLLEPSLREDYEITLHGLSAVYITIVVLLVGCVSIGEEKMLGLAAWHLTLPVSTGRQWQVKLLVTGGMTLVMGFVLPLLLACLTLVKAKVGLIALADADLRVLLVLLTVAMVVFVLGFWSASLWESTLRSALATLGAIIGFSTCASLAAWWANQFDGLQGNLVSNFLAHYQLPPDFFTHHETAIVSLSPDMFERHEGVAPYCVAIVVIPVLIVALVQSRTQFRRALAQSKVKLKYAFILAVLIFAGSFWCVDLAKSVGPPRAYQLIGEISAAMEFLPTTKANIESANPWSVTVQELERTGSLSARARHWLKDTKITVTPVWRSNQQVQSRQPSCYEVSLSFPNGRSFSFYR